MDQNVEIKAWEERISFKRTTLSKPWKLPPTVFAEHHKQKAKKNHLSSSERKAESPAKKQIDFKTLPLAAHSIRSLKILILSYLSTLHRFTPADLMAVDHIHHAASCVARRGSKSSVTEREVAKNVLTALDLLLKDGNIIIPHPKDISSDISIRRFGPSTEEPFIVVGKWNLSSTITAVAKRDGKVVVREVWKKIVNWGNGWEGTSKGVVGGIVEEVLTGLEGQEWAESKAGVWTRLDV